MIEDAWARAVATGRGISGALRLAYLGAAMAAAGGPEATASWTAGQ